jgi:dienelactone hydrolase
MRLIKSILLTIVLLFTANSYAFFFNTDAVDINATARVKVYKVDKQPASTVIIIPGSDGWQGMGYSKWVSLINRWGYNAVLIDLFEKRGYREIPSQGHLIPFADRARDIDETVNYIVKQPWATNKVALIGFSQGGATVIEVGKRIKNPSIVAGVGLYPSCYWVPPNVPPAMPVILHIGMRDDWAKPKYCGEINPAYKVYNHPYATHSFDLELHSRVVHGHNLSYDKEADMISQNSSKQLFDSVLTDNSK